MDPIKNGDIPASYVSLPEGILSCISTIQLSLRGLYHVSCISCFASSPGMLQCIHPYIFAESIQPSAPNFHQGDIIFSMFFSCLYMLSGFQTRRKKHVNKKSEVHCLF